MTSVSSDLTPQQKRDLLAQLLRQQKADQEVTAGPLSYGQRSLWFLYELDRNSTAYNVMYAAHVRADLDVDALERAFQKIVQRHPSLRTTYDTKNSQPAQFIHAQQPFQLQTIDARTWNLSQLDAEIQTNSNQPFDLRRGPVIRVQLFERPGDRHVLLFVAHHIALDFWSFDLLFDELELLYRAEMEGEDLSLPEPACQYTDFVRWQEQLLAGGEGERLWSYWKEQLAGELPTLDLPTDRPRPPVQTYGGESLQFHLPDELSAQLIALAKREAATLYATLLAAFEILLYRYSGQQDVLVGSPTAGRSRAEFESILGYFLNPVVLRAKLRPELSFREVLADAKQQVLGGITHQDFPFPLLVERLHPPRDASRSPIFSVAFGWDKPRRIGGAKNDNSRAAATDRGRLGLEPFALGQQGSAFDLMLMMLNVGESLSAALQYNSDLFDRGTVERMLRHFQVLLHGIAANPDQPIADLPLLSEAEQTELLVERNQTRADYPRCRLHELVEAQTNKTPQSVAVVFGDERLTYAELNSRANQLAHFLKARGAGPDGLVGLFVDRSPLMLIGMLGILKAGSAYVPLTPGTPYDRLTYMLDQCGTPLVVTTRDHEGQLPPRGGTTIRLDADWPEIAAESGDNLNTPSRDSDLAYVIFTSGSTGKPKGVQLEHRSVVNFLNSMSKRPGIDANDVLLAVTTMTFDISVLELFLPLTVGASVVIVDREVAADGMQLARRLQQSGATIMQATPATWRLLIDAGWQGDPALKILCGGEALPRDLAEKLLRSGGSVWNMYGPTETTIWSAIDRVQAGDGPVPIGRPIDNTQLYILDSRLRPVPPGVTGDLYIGGDGLARGYLHEPQLTAERFVADPFHSGSDQRFYKTGDLARYRAGGNIEFLGRTDFQVKIRGFRIELGEIEALLNTHPGLRESVVTARQTGPSIDDKQLVAYFIPASDVVPNVSELRDFLRQELPDYMLPSTFVRLESFPLNPAGKVDRQALPQPEGLRPELKHEYVAPRNESEQALAEIWESVLGLDQVGVHDNFFDLGGASIQSLEIAAHASERGIEMTPAMMFKHPTIAELAASASAIGGAVLPAASANHVSASLPQRETQTLVEAQPANLRPTKKANVIIESLGIYLPPKEVTSKEILAGCKKPMWFPLERMTGIKTRRMAGDDEFSIDLARKAVEECLANSRYDVDDIELVVCCNIARIDRPLMASLEPNTSMQLKRHFGFKNAIVFDIANACTGMFTGISIVEAFITSGQIRRGLVVSGDFITGITRTAQLEISEFFDPRLACLTVGDAGAAILLEEAPSNDVGFHELDLYSLTKYSRMCIGKLTDQPHGGAIMHVPNPMEHTAVAIKHSVMNAQYVFARSPWKPEQMQQLIMHQTSAVSLRDGKRAINKAFKKKICTDENTINNLAHRGNTATTSHFVAVWDHVLNGRIRSGDNVVFGITGSGQTIGTGIYTFDDLPDRLRKAKQTGVRPAKAPGELADRHALAALPRVKVQCVAAAPLEQVFERDTTKMCVQAAEDCLALSPYDRSDIELLLFAGISRTDYICEPAIATFIGGDLKMNDVIESEHDKKTFVFDVYNGALSFLYACQIASRMIQSGRCNNAMIVAAEIEMNAANFPDKLHHLKETASAMILERSAAQGSGFGDFLFKYFPQYHESRTVYGWIEQGKPYTHLAESPELHDHYLKCISLAVDELLERSGLERSMIKLVLPPQFSTKFNRALGRSLGIAPERVLDLGQEGTDLFTSAFSHSMAAALDRGLAQPGDIALIVNVASGIQVGCATYYF
ncbi:MAG: amino acid adenylation domain-containing protein [Planctomycetota bacterium]